MVIEDKEVVVPFKVVSLPIGEELHIDIMQWKVYRVWHESGIAFFLLMGVVEVPEELQGEEEEVEPENGWEE